MESLKQWLISSSKSPIQPVVPGMGVGLHVGPASGTFPSEREKASQQSYSVCSQYV